MRISQSPGPNFFSRASGGDEGIIIRNPVLAVFADCARGSVLLEIGDYSKNLAHKRVEPLRIRANIALLLTRSTVARPDIHHAPIGVAAFRSGIEDHVPHG